MTEPSHSSTDHWSAQAYQEAASFVPKLATRVLEWLDPREGEVVLDVGCGDGILTLQIANILTPSGKIHGIDSSNDMILAAKTRLKTSNPPNSNITFELLNANSLTTSETLQTSSFDKVFSNAAMHWIISPTNHHDFFRGIHQALKPGGRFVFEMGGMGNCAEMRAAFLSCVSKRVGIEKARSVDPWFFPDEAWMRRVLEENGFVVVRSELEYRPTPMESGSGGGVEGWSRLMGKLFFDVIGDGEERERCLMEAVEVLRTVVMTPDGEEIVGYCRLRVDARKS